MAAGGEAPFGSAIVKPAAIAIFQRIAGILQETEVVQPQLRAVLDGAVALNLRLGFVVGFVLFDGNIGGPDQLVVDMVSLNCS